MAAEWSASITLLKFSTQNSVVFFWGDTVFNGHPPCWGLMTSHWFGYLRVNSGDRWSCRRLIRRRISSSIPCLVVSLTSCINNPGNHIATFSHSSQIIFVKQKCQFLWNHQGISSFKKNSSNYCGKNFGSVQVIVPTCLRGMVRPLPICPFFILLSSSGFPFCCNEYKQRQDNSTVNNNNQGSMSARRSSSAQRSQNVYKVQWVLCCYDYTGLVVAWCQCAEACAEAEGCWSVVWSKITWRQRRWRERKTKVSYIKHEAPPRVKKSVQRRASCLAAKCIQKYMGLLYA